MGRHRTSRAKDKLVMNVNRKLNQKRNRDLKLKTKRNRFLKNKAKRYHEHQNFLKENYPSLFPEQKEIKRVNKLPNQVFLERVALAQESYDAFIEQVDASDCVIIALDARDPNAFRFMELEGELKNKNKNGFVVLTKIDLVPAEDVRKWIGYLKNDLGTTIGLSLVNGNEKESMELFKKTIESVAPDAKNIVVVGAPNIGKTTLCKLAGDAGIKVNDSNKWQWTICGNSLALTNSIMWKGRTRELAVDILCRVTGDNLCDIMGIKMENSPGNLLVSYARKLEVSKTEVPEIFIQKFTSGEWKWYAEAPKNESEIEISDIQENVLKGCSSETSFIVLAHDVPVKMDVKALSYEIPDDDDQSEENDEVSDDDNEFNEEEDEN